MKPLARLLIPIAITIGLVLLPGGCPVTVPQLELSAPAPGSYWVTVQDGQLYYFEPAQERGDQGEWLALHEDGEWYVGPGFYRLADDLTWSRDGELEGVTLDEALQLHDPPPAVPSYQESQ
jgi:hypothetical protein